MSFERDQDEREDEEIRKAFAEKDAQIEQLQARIAALESVCRRLNRALDAALAKCGEPKLTFSKGISASARAAEARRAR